MKLTCTARIIWGMPRLAIALFLHAAGQCDVKADNTNSTTSFFADNAYGRGGTGPWISPCGQHFNNVTYLTYQGPAEGAYIAAYNHTSKVWKGPVKVLDNPMGGVNPEVHPTKCESGSCVDSHGAPHIAISDDGYINVFGGGHGGCDHAIEGTVWGDNIYGQGCKFRKQFPNDPSHIGIQRHARSLKPEDIFQWEKIELDVSGLMPHASYGANLISGGDIYTVVRGGSHTADWIYQKSTDGGKTFGEPVRIFKYENTKKRLFVAWYVRCFVGNEQATKKKDRIGCFATWHNHQTGWDQEGNTLHGPDRRNIYYIEIETSTGNFYNIHNKQLKSPITFEEANSHALVYESYESANNGTFVEPYDARFNKHGDPEVLIHQYINPFNGWVGPRKTKNFVYTAFNSNTSAWYIPIPIYEEDFDPGVTNLGLFDKTKDKDVSAVMVRGSSSVDYFDGSRSSIDTGSIPSFTKNNEKSFEGEFTRWTDIRNPHKEGRLMVLDYLNGTENLEEYYMGIHLYGDDGFVERNSNESSGLWKKCWEATTDDECFVGCPMNEKLLKVVLNSVFNVDVLIFKIFEKQDGKWDQILEKKPGELPFSYETCLSVSGDFQFKLKARRSNEIDDSTSFGEYKLIWGGDMLVEKEYPVPKEGQVKEKFRVGQVPSSPSPSPSSTSMAPSFQGDCSQNGNSRFLYVVKENTGKKIWKTCNHLTGWTKKRKENVCRRDYGNGSEAKFMCRTTCGTCPSVA